MRSCKISPNWRVWTNLFCPNLISKELSTILTHFPVQHTGKNNAIIQKNQSCFQTVKQKLLNIHLALGITSVQWWLLRARPICRISYFLSQGQKKWPRKNKMVSRFIKYAKSWMNSAAELTYWPPCCGSYFKLIEFWSTDLWLSINFVPRSIARLYVFVFFARNSQSLHKLLFRHRITFGTLPCLFVGKIFQFYPLRQFDC